MWTNRVVGPEDSKTVLGNFRDNATRGTLAETTALDGICRTVDQRDHMIPGMRLPRVEWARACESLGCPRFQVNELELFKCGHHI